MTNIAITWRRIPERYCIIGSICKTCSTKYFPLRKFCPKCRRKGKMERYQFSPRGTIYSYTKVYAPPAGFELEAPYILAIVKLDEGPMLSAQIVNTQNVEIGDRVEMVFRVIKRDEPEGLIHYGYKFEKITD
ncbi:MAG: Zn-ribbon domain-containing OB-fold protein [Candidatus Micrarchaeota archaeon]|nr:Zn-ribbon domain-containing OB-fold protein [Candidatus Micrarchaeota archaeon]